MAVITSEPIEQATELLQNLKVAATAPQEQTEAQAVETSDSESSSAPGQDDNSSDSSSSDSGRQEAPAAQAQKQQPPTQAQGYADSMNWHDHRGEQLHGPGFVLQPLRFGYASPPPYITPMSPVAGDGCIYAPLPYHFPGPHAAGMPYLPSSPIDASFAGEPNAPFVPYPPMMVAGEPVFGGEQGFYGQPHLSPCMSPPMMVAAGDPMEAFGQQRPGFGYPRSVVPFDRPAWHDSKASGKASSQQQQPKTAFHTLMPTQSFRPKVQWQRPPMMAPPAFARGYVPYGKVGGDLRYSLYGYERLGPEGKGFAQFANGCGGAFDVMNEQIRGPRASRLGVKAPADSKKSETLSSLAIEQYNRSDFVTSYEDAKFFVIKSYSEDDVHKSIKYGVWASTPKGNRRLDAAYKEAQSRISAKEGASCPVFLFFSVNASGQFCGVAEMCGPVDFVKSMEFWQQEKKWNGFFAVKWHFIKDVPNRQFRHILLENNDNDPVTNSRDTQEVKLKQGNEMLSIFKKYSSKLSLLDDFQYYETRQKAMQDSRSRPEAQRPGEKPAAAAAAEGGKGHGENGRSEAADVVSAGSGKVDAVSTPPSGQQ